MLCHKNGILFVITKWNEETVMDIKIISENGKMIISPKGRIDTNTSVELQKVLIPAFDKSSAIELDFSGVQYISSKGLGILLEASNMSDDTSVSMTISNVPKIIHELFRKTGFDKTLTIV